MFLKIDFVGFLGPNSVFSHVDCIILSQNSPVYINNDDVIVVNKDLVLCFVFVFQPVEKSFEYWGTHGCILGRVKK